MTTPAVEHHCHWPNCPVEISPKLHSCLRHWKALPYGIRAEILRCYVPGQEQRKDPSEAYMAAAMAARSWALDHPERN
jgi:hypothetical protein